MGEAGLKLVDRDDLILKRRMSAGSAVRPFDLLSSMIEAWPGLIVEKDTVRVVSREAALEYWIKRLKK